MRNLTLLGDRLLCRMQIEEERGGILLPDKRNLQERRAVVAFAGPKAEAKAGEMVVLDLGGDWLTFDGERFASVRNENVLAILDHE